MYKSIKDIIYNINKEKMNEHTVLLINTDKRNKIKYRYKRKNGNKDNIQIVIIGILFLLFILTIVYYFYEVNSTIH